jgi:23S rRNA pseudouridine1911/1915/1917 synthase
VPPDRTFTIPAALAGQTLAAALRQLAGSLSWSEARRLIAARHVRVGGSLCLDDTRRLHVGERIEVAARPGSAVPREQDVRVVHVDADLVILDKPPGIQSVRRHEERGWDDERKRRQPTLDEIVQRLLPTLVPKRGKQPAALPPVRPVHRLDRDTSGLMLFALSVRAQETLVKMFAAHAVRRTYLAVVQGRFAEARTIESWLVRDRGDGLRGSVPDAAQPGRASSPDSDNAPKHAITHVRPLEYFGARYTLVECRLETGRTHQIRIHLSEIGHPLCGENRYLSPAPDTLERADDSGAPRTALHSAELELDHPVTGKALRFSSPLPQDLDAWIARLRGK